ncbi:MAG: N-formylglutamate amidohydrolase [Planctomycetota bacterium]|jgi:formiminoglutamase
MMKLPILISVPHAGLEIPSEVRAYNLLTQKEIIDDGDGGASEIYAVESYVQAYVTTDVARAYVDMNRSENDRTRDGVVKTHTCRDVPIYIRPLPADLIDVIIKKYYRPYHEKLTSLSSGVRFGIDCHTMADVGPPISPDPGQKRPLVCLSNADGTFSVDWLKIMKDCFQQSFQVGISLNQPFKGGNIIRTHASEMPWVQVEISRTNDLDNKQKHKKFLDAIKQFHSIIMGAEPVK